MATCAEKTELLISEPAEVYHAKARDYLSSHQLADFRKCPQLYYRKKHGLIPDSDRPAYVVGRALHTLVLEGEDQFDSEYTVGGPINPQTGAPFGPKTKAFAEWVASHGKTVLTDAQYASVNAMAASVKAHELAADLLSEGQPEGVVRTEYCGVPCQIRLDWFNPHAGIVDLKSADDIDWFESDARRYGYAYQMAFYRAVLAQRISIAMPVHFVAVEKQPPNRCGVWRVDQDVLSHAQRENEAAIERLKQCEQKGEFSTGYEETRYFDFL